MHLTPALSKGEGGTEREQLLSFRLSVLQIPQDSNVKSVGGTSSRATRWNSARALVVFHKYKCVEAGLCPAHKIAMFN